MMLTTVLRTFVSFVVISGLAFTPACRHGGSPETVSETKITNGVPVTAGEFEAVVAIIGGGLCTGTFVSDSTLITASHCVMSGPGQLTAVRLKDRNVSAIRVLAHPSATGQVGTDDLAVVIFPDGTSTTWMNIAKRNPQPGDPITIVGFGKSDHFDETSAGIKRKGTNVLRANTNGFLTFNGVTRGDRDNPTGQNSASSQGDSGGPMFINNELVGVTSGGYSENSAKHSLYVNILAELNLRFLNQTLSRGARIPSLAGPTDPQQPPVVQPPATPEALWVGLGAEDGTGTDAFTLHVSAPAGTARLVYCQSAVVSLCQNVADGDLGKTQKSYDLGTRPVFTSIESFNLEEDLGLSFVAYDEAGKILGAATIRFEAVAD